MGGNSAKYVALLRRFAVDHREVPARVAAHLRAGDREAARQLAHSLKGTAGTVGATALADAAARLDSMLRETDGLDAASRVDLIGAMSQALEDLSGALPSADLDTAPGVSHDARHVSDAAPEVLDALTALLIESSPAARDLCESQAPVLREVLEGRFPLLVAQLDAFDFDAALELVQAEGSTDSVPLHHD